MNDKNNTPPSSIKTVAVFDIGKTNVKLNVVTAQGEVLETLSTPNPSLDGPPYRHHDLAGLEDWLLTNLAALASRHPPDHLRRLRPWVRLRAGGRRRPRRSHDRLRTAAPRIGRARLCRSRRPLP